MSTPLASASSLTATTPNDHLVLRPAVDQLVTHLVSPLLPSLPSHALASLRTSLTSTLETLYSPTWHPQDPIRGSGFRSLISVAGRLPRPLRQAALNSGAVEVAVWEKALGGGEWQAWCDPGRVSWRDGGWEWEDGVYYLGGWKDTLRTLWAAPSAIPATTPRPSHAVAIRPPTSVLALPSSPLPTPTTFLTPPTPSSGPPLPPLSERPDSPLGSESSSSTFTSTSAVSTTSSSHPSIIRHGHTSSVSSMTSSDNNHSRTRSSSPTKKPSVTAYDGGKVGVLGGGVKLGGGASSPSSPKKQQSSYALNSYLSAGGQQGQSRGRKIGRQPGLFGASSGGAGGQGLMGPPSMGLFAYRG